MVFIKILSYTKHLSIIVICSILRITHRITHRTRKKIYIYVNIYQKKNMFHIRRKRVICIVIYFKWRSSSIFCKLLNSNAQEIFGN